MLSTGCSNIALIVDLTLVHAPQELYEKNTDCVRGAIIFTPPSGSIRSQSRGRARRSECGCASSFVDENESCSEKYGGHL